MPDLPSRFGPYEILGPLGAGGMGQVYRARDTRLERTVALKVLHDAAALDPDRRRRFAQEARAASALSHPNILTVYDIGVEGDTPYLVSELIEGRSLRSEINRGRMPLRRMVEIAQQVAEGLAAAHEAGIVHRDLKPENVMVTGDGRVKIVDFGLAKVQEGDGSAALPVTTTETAEGLILGTVPYMSPEQARGEKADFRSDQFALGVMVYEMTAGAHPFKRDTAVQTLSAIITDEPPDPALARPDLPTAVRWLLRRLLAKKPRERYAHTADLATDLRNIRDYLSEATSAVTTAPVRRLNWRLPAAAGAIATAGLVVGLVSSPEDRGVQFRRYTPLATDAGYQKNASWSPDGTQIAYEAEVDGIVQIFTRTLTSAMRTKVTASAVDCWEPFWSSDGFIYYHAQARDQHALWRVSPVGGEPEVMIEGAYRSAISPDGQTVAYLRTDSATSYSVTLWFASPVTGTPRRFDGGHFKDRSGSTGLLRFSPDGSKLLVWLGPDDLRAETGFWIIPMPSGEPRSVLPGLGLAGHAFPAFSWLPDNRRVVLTRSDGPTSGTHLWVADTESGDTWPLTVTPGNETAPGVSPDGRTIAFTAESPDYDLVEVPLDGSALRPFLSSRRNEYDPATSPVNSQYAFVTDRTGDQQIWLQNEEAYLQQVFVSEASFGGVVSASIGALAFSPDGRRLAFQRAAGSNAPGEKFAGSRVWIASTSGGAPVPIGNDDYYQDAPTWSPDGEWIAYVRGAPDQFELVKERVGGRGSALSVLTRRIPAFVSRPKWSPDAKWILCETLEGLAVIAPDGSGARVISGAGWLAYDWADDSRLVYGLHPTDDGNHFMLVSLDSQSGVERVINANLGTMPVALQPLRGFSRRRGGGFLTSIARPRSDIYLIEGVQLPLSKWQRLWPFSRPG